MPPPNSRSASGNVSDTGGNVTPDNRTAISPSDTNRVPGSNQSADGTTPSDSAHAPSLFGARLSPPRPPYAENNDFTSALPPLVTSRYAVPHYTSTNRFSTVFGLGSRVNPSDFMLESIRQRRANAGSTSARPFSSRVSSAGSEPYFSMNYIPDQLRNIERTLSRNISELRNPDTIADAPSSSDSNYETDGQSSSDEEELQRQHQRHRLHMQHVLQYGDPLSSFENEPPYYSEDELVGLEFSTAEQDSDTADAPEVDSANTRTSTDSTEPTTAMSPIRSYSQYIDYVPGGSTQTSDHTNNERTTLSIQNLLLRSGRQNPTLLDTVLPVPARMRQLGLSHHMHHTHRNSNFATSGIPLQRQNAIRHRTRREDPKPAGVSKNTMTREQRHRAKQEELALINTNFSHMANEIDRILQELYKRKGHKEKSPIFQLEQKRKDIAQVLSTSTGCVRMSFRTSEWVALDYKESMNEFLTKRRFDQLTLASTPETQSQKRTISQGKPRKRLRFQESKKTARATETDNSDTVEQKEEFEPAAETRNVLMDISSTEIDNILSCQYSSHFTSGSSFHLDHIEPQGFQANLCFPIVDYQNKKVEALFDFTADPYVDNVTNWNHLFSFIEYFPFSYYHLPLNSALSQRVYLIQRIKVAFKSRLPEDREFFSKLSFQVFATGNIIDFKKNDMRFLDIEDTVWDPLCVHFHKYRANLVRVQLLSWLRINPFLQVQEDYMYIYLEEMSKKFKELNSSSRKSKKHMIMAARDIHTLAAQNYSFTRPNNNYKATRNIISSGSKQSARYIDDWEFKFTNTLSEKLVEENPVTLVNIQLNYVLFTIKVDALDFLDRFITFVLNLIKQNNLKNSSNHDYKTYNEYHSLIKSQSRASTLGEREDDKVYLLCSLNRKTGQLEIQNSAPHLRHFGLSSTKEQERSMSVSSEGKEFLDAWQGERNNSRLFSLNPNLQPPLMGQLLGVPARFSKRKSSGAGSQSFAFV